jgi:hypothetical protein
VLRAAEKAVRVTTLESTTERLESALRRLAVEAGDLFDELLRQGAELPFEIEPSERGPLPMYQYHPRTGEFIRGNAAELRRLEAFVEVRELAGEEEAIGFLTGLWEGRSEFTLIEDHLRGAIDAVLATVGGEGSATGEVIVPLIGFHMPGDEIELDGVRIVRADRIEDAPLEALEGFRSGKGRAGFLAIVRCAAAASAPAAAVADDLRRALRAMRLFRPGSVGLAPHGWVRRADGWERFGTGANRPRHGGYRLTGNEASDLEAFSGTLASRGARMPALDWAISRFDLGAERPSLIEALSDYLLALRGLLEGGGATRVALSARVAALVADGQERDRARITVERSLAIERKLMSGSRFTPSADSKPLAVIAELEELLRQLLRGMIAGELEGDLRARADEILLTDGLGVGETGAPIGETAEWVLPEPVTDEITVTRGEQEGEESEPSAQPEGQVTTRIIVDDVELPTLMADESPKPEGSERREGRDWFAAPDGGGEVDWPAFASPRRDAGAKKRSPRQQDGEASDRVRYLFPVPDSTDWEVGELAYERKGRQVGR